MGPSLSWIDISVYQWLMLSRLHGFDRYPRTNSSNGWMGSTAILLANSTWLTWQHSYLMSRGVWPLLLVRCFVLLLFLSTLRLQKLGDIIHSGTVVYDSKWSSYRFEWRNCKKYEKKKWNTFFENRPKNEFKILPSPPDWLRKIFSRLQRLGRILTQ